MIFAHTLDEVLCGKKSQTRRVIKPNEQLNISGECVQIEIPGKRVVYQVGKTYAVQPGRGKKSVARIKIINIRREAIGAITQTDAQAEGFLSPADFLKTWRVIHGNSANLLHDVWVLEFELDVTYTQQHRSSYEQSTEDRRTHHCNDLSAPIAGVSGVGLHSRNYSRG